MLAIETGLTANLAYLEAMLKPLAANPGVFCLILVGLVIVPFGTPLGRPLSFEASFGRPFVLAAMVIFRGPLRTAMLFEENTGLSSLSHERDACGGVAAGSGQRVNEKNR